MLRVVLLLAAVAVCAVNAEIYGDDHDVYHETEACNIACLQNNDCHGYLCSRCNENGQCVRGVSCGSDCTYDTDCDQLTPCSVCVSGKCSNTKSCGGLCKNNNQCPNQGCTQCEWPGICVPGGPCKASCEVDTDCNRLGMCRCCVNNECVAGCGQQCTSADQCESACPFCTEGFCRPFDSSGSFISFPSSPSSAPPAPSPDGGECDNDFLEVTVRVPKSSACKKCST